MTTAGGFLRNRWYTAATAAELGEAPLGRTICGEPLVLFRGGDGSVAALGDRCPHRKYALSKGIVIGDDIQCGYHGLRFDGTGTCTLIPSRQEIPVGLRARAYPTVERHALIFVWMGDPASADPALLPDFHENSAFGWTAVHGYHYVRAHYQLLIDNLLDLTHIPIVHKTTLAGPGIMENPLEVTVEGDLVRTRRLMRGVDPAPIHRTIRHFPGKIDRSQQTEFHLPAYVHIDLGAVPAGSNEDITRPHHVLMNSLTPETERSTHYFWSVARWMALDDAAVSERLLELNRIAFDEDATILETQQKMIESDTTGEPLASLDGDKASTAVRRIIARALAPDAKAGQ